MNDFTTFADQWKKLNEESQIKPVSFQDCLPQMELHRQGKLIEIVPPPLHSLSGAFAWALERLYIFSGYPNSGKTEILRYMANHYTLATGHGCAMFTPEATTAIFYDELLIQTHSLIGSDAQSHIQNHWRILEVEEGMPNVSQLVEVMKELREKQNYRMFIIDPMNWVASDSWEGLRIALTVLKQFAKKTQSIVCYVEHPKTPQANKDGEYPKVSSFLINNGVMHWNKVDCMCLIHRERSLDVYGNAKSSESDTILFEVVKMKDQKYLGRPGSVQLRYHWQTHSYSDMF